MSEKEGAPKNGPSAAVLTTLASSSNMWVQLSTVALVAISGFGNWAATWESSDRNKQEIVQKADRIRAEAKQQIDDIHKWIAESQDEFHKGNIDSSINRRILSQFKDEMSDFERRQMVMLSNQSSMLENQGKILAEQNKIMDQMHGWVEEHKKQEKPQE